jgi:hypothetical protein
MFSRLLCFAHSVPRRRTRKNLTVQARSQGSQSARRVSPEEGSEMTRSARAQLRKKTRTLTRRPRSMPVRAQRSSLPSTSIRPTHWRRVVVSGVHSKRSEEKILASRLVVEMESMHIGMTHRINGFSNCVIDSVRQGSLDSLLWYSGG